MKTTFQTIIFTLLVVLCACSETLQSLGLDSQVGTIVNRPKPPSNNIFPDFDETLPQPDFSAATSALVLKTARAAVLDDSTAGTDSPAQIWADLFYDGQIVQLHDVHNTLLNSGELVAKAIAELSLEEIPTELTTVSTATATKLVETTAVWDVEFMLETGTTDHMRFYFRNKDTGLVEATYLAQFDADGNPLKGLIAYVNLNNLGAGSGTGKRLYALAFDFSDKTKLTLVERVESFHTDLNRYRATQFYYQCDEETGDCIGEPLSIGTPPPTRDFEADSDIRFVWNTNTYDVCLATMNYDNSTVEFGTTYKFTATTTGLPDESKITADACTLPTPVWGMHVFTTNDLIMRFEETTPEGGTAVAYFLDGILKSGWDSLTASMIGTWVDGSGY